MAKKSSTIKAAPPPVRSCGAEYVHLMLCDQHPELRAERSKIHLLMDRMMSDATTFRRMVSEKMKIITIPVVVHVVHRTAAENISDAQIASQIKVLNLDYRAQNPDRTGVPSVWTGVVSDSRIEFGMATKDPNGKATTGITRTKTKATGFPADDSVKANATGGHDAWPADKYLNVWVCSLRNNLLGYAQFPGMRPETDGVVILNTAFGTTGTARTPFNLGRTATHEIGHWLNLNHIWGDTNDCSGTDHVNDTPPARTANTGVPAFPHISCNNAPNGDMFMNYMDYVDDRAMFMFSAGQVARMRATLAGPRSSFS